MCSTVMSSQYQLGAHSSSKSRNRRIKFMGMYSSFSTEERNRSLSLRTGNRGIRAEERSAKIEVKHD